MTRTYPKISFDKSDLFKSWKPWKYNLCSFWKPHVWWKCTQRLLLTKLEVLKISKTWKIQKHKLYHFVSRPIDENVLKELFWQKCGLFKTLKLEKINKDKGYDPNSCFSGINFFSGLSLWRLQFEKRSLMGCLFFDADFSKIFHFGR